MTNSDEPAPARELYDRHADEFAEATTLDGVSEEFRALLESTRPSPRS